MSRIEFLLELKANRISFRETCPYIACVNLFRAKKFAGGKAILNQTLQRIFASRQHIRLVKIQLKASFPLIAKWRSQPRSEASAVKSIAIIAVVGKLSEFLK